MKYIPKMDGGIVQLNRAHERPPSTPAEAESRWSSFRKHKALVSSILLENQYSLCAYSEIRPDEYNLGTHIEHVAPKSKFPLCTFDFKNLVVSALSSDDLKKMNKEDVFGGHAKLSSSIPVDCLQTNCSSFFEYPSNGRIIPSTSLSSSDQAKAKDTIEKLNLDKSPYLVNKRKNWIDELDELIDEHIKNGDSLEDLAQIYLLPRNDKLDQFHTATRQRFGSIADKVLGEQAPKEIKKNLV